MSSFSLNYQGLIIVDDDKQLKSFIQLMNNPYSHWLACVWFILIIINKLGKLTNANLGSNENCFIDANSRLTQGVSIVNDYDFHQWLQLTNTIKDNLPL